MPGKTRQPKDADIYSRLIAEVVHGTIRPGERLGEESLAARWNVGRNAVREALFRLEQDGLLTRKPKVGTFVREINDREYLEIYDLRIAIECVVIRRLAEVVTDENLALLADLAKRVDGLPKEDGERHRLDHDFHNKLCELSGLSYAPQMLRLAHLHSRCSLLNQQLTLMRGYPDQAVPKPDHREIVVALRRREPEVAVDVLRGHLETAKKSMRRDIEIIKSKMAALTRAEH